ncbi:hypothetical protein SAMN06265380_10219 [Ruegeria faecimaris]|uniref:Uncharacterized protein n=1 Tax=Ruegeria faecimaris TaxID=686389 RepID=A0A521BZE1_9RHOB|nr:hypothetical protein SAMN06265380_10219 [Ruegeria faecimaris]
MPAQNPLHISAVCASRAACAVAGIILLLLQLLSPALASPGQSMWVEICSEGGAVWVEVDLEKGDADPTAPCPKCADCALCAVTGAAPLPMPLEVTLRGRVQFLSCQNNRSFELNGSDRLWPETRGPPPAPEFKTQRAPRASMASIPIIGGAPWS